MAANRYATWFAEGHASAGDVRHLAVQFSVFSHLFVEAQLRKVINAADLRIDLAHAIAMNDVRSQLDNLIFKGFVRQVPGQWLAQYPRYLAAIAQRLDKLPAQVQRDRVWTDELQGFWQQYQSLNQRYQVEGREDQRLQQWRWVLEEYRVSLFAQQLGTRMPVSDKRLKKLWQEITA